MKTIDIESHFTDLDRAILENNVEYERYIKFVTHILDAFTRPVLHKTCTLLWCGVRGGVMRV